ncbi:MAG: Cadmium, cobalt and zinc/H(+)-K(+) antiporter [Anaerolineales bacterium]|nr:Cadmium, cobalt and zinc/H(+)-K(+) antiporter [Anaerolineales bacterium]
MPSPVRASHDHAHDTTTRLRTAFVLNLTFTLVEVVGGLFTNSLAILSDSLHDLGDSLSIGFSWWMEHRAHRPSQGRYSYGFRRLSLVAALVNAVVLILGSLIVLGQAIPRLFAPQPSNARGMLVLAVLGIIVNGAAVLRMRGGRGMNAQMIAWHLLEDVLGWVAVLIVSLSLLVTDIEILDPLLSMLITGYVLYNVIRNLRRTVAIFLQAAPADLDIHAIEHELETIAHVLSTHHTHAWSLDGEHHVLTTHLVVPAGASKTEIVQVKADALRLFRQIDLEHTTIEVEYEDEDCRMRDE